MAVPSSGELELYGDIGTELGVAQSNVTLHGMSQTAGFTPPDAMSEFYGYSSGSSPLSTVLYTGNGSSVQQVTGVGFKPDLFWVKARGLNQAPNIFDSIRGGELLRTSNTAASGGNYLQYINDGIEFLVTDPGWNQSGQNYVAWCFKGGGPSVTNTSGSITSQVSANVEGGFSVVSCTATGGVDTIGHGLGVAPSVIIYKTRSTTGNWSTYHQSLGNTRGVYLNLTSAAVTSTFFWNNTSPTSDVFTAYGSAGNTHIAYCFAEKAGVSKFGTYTGGTANNLITLGFKPAFVMIKSYSGVSEQWAMYDNKRSPTNPVNDILYAQSSAAESVNNTNQEISFDANGFTLIDTNSLTNLSGSSYIYMAFA